MRRAGCVMAVVLAQLGSAPVHADEPRPGHDEDALPALEDEDAREQDAMEEEAGNEQPGPVDSRPTAAPTPPPVAPLWGPGLKRVLALTTTTAPVGIPGCLAGAALGCMLSLPVMVAAGLAVRFGALPRNASYAGIMTFMYGPPLIVTLGALVGYAASRIVAPFVLPQPADDGSWQRLRPAASFIFLGVDALAHALILAPVMLVAIAVGIGAGVMGGQSMIAPWVALAPSRFQVGAAVGLLYGFSALGVLAPAAAALIYGVVPFATVVAASAVSDGGKP